MKPPDASGAQPAPATESLPPETEAAVLALEDARHELVTEEGLIAMEPGSPAEEGFVLDHKRVVNRIDRALKPFEGKYDDAIHPEDE